MLLIFSTGAQSLFALIDGLLPQPNLLPTPHAYAYRMKKNFRSEIRFSGTSSTDVFCVLHFTELLKDVVQRNWNAILDYSDQRKQGLVHDISLEKAALVNDFSEVQELSLILSTDGVSIVDSGNEELWPVWLAVAQLPPILRMARKNIVLAALFKGKTKPCWDVIVPHLEDELLLTVEIFGPSQTDCFEICFKVVFIVSDLIAKCQILNMYQHNGFYGCTFCTAAGVTIGRSHCYYPFEQEYTLRTPEVHSKHVQVAEMLLKRNEKWNVCGVKGKSAFARIVEGLPLTAGIDYMHCILLGVYPDVLRNLLKSLNREQKVSINELIDRIHAPREVIKHARKIRGLDEMSFFKANEFANYFFYVGPVILKNFVDEKLFDHSMKLVTAIRLLQESCEELDLVQAESSLNSFCENIVEHFQSEKNRNHKCSCT